jgi:hypothetical protein
MYCLTEKARQYLYFFVSIKYVDAFNNSQVLIEQFSIHQAGTITRVINDYYSFPKLICRFSAVLVKNLRKLCVEVASSFQNSYENAKDL